MKAAGKRAGVPWVGVHALRHTAATLYFRYGKNADGSNVNAVQVQRLLGHHSAAFTLATYVHLLPDDLPDPEFLDEVVAGGKVPAKVSGTPADIAQDEAVEEVAERAR